MRRVSHRWRIAQMQALGTVSCLEDYLVGSEDSRATDDLNSLFEGRGLSQDSAIGDSYTSDLDCVDGK